MISIYRKLLALLTPPERRRFFALMVVLLLVGLVETVGIASILPFLAVASNPGILESNVTLSTFYRLSGAEDPRAFVILLGGALFLIVVAGLLFKALGFHLLYKFTSWRSYSITTRLMHGYLGQGYSWFLTRNTSDLGKSMLSEVDKMMQKVMKPALRFVAYGISMLCMVTLLVAVNPTAALSAAALLASSYALVYAAARRRVKRFGLEQVAGNRERFRIVGEAFGGIKDVKSKGVEKLYLQDFRKAASRVARAEAFIMTLTEAPRFVIEAVAFGGMLLFVLMLMATEAPGGGLSGVLPILGLYAFAGIRMFPAAQQLYAAFTKLRFGSPLLDSLHRALSDVEAAARSPLPDPPTQPLHLRERLELRDVRFAYPTGARPALNGLDLTIAANTTVGIVGGSGAGKTTAIDVILGLLEPQSGTFTVDGARIDDANRRAWRRSIGYVPQNIYLSDDTVARNIAFGVPPQDIDMAAVERAARVAELHEFVTSELPDGYATVTGERGVRLSGGQRQRIGIARALYHDPDVLVLDEATSALDNVTERAVMDAVANLGHRKTILIVAHRLTTVRGCDVICLLERGRLIAQGSYEELFSTNPHFRRLAAASEHGSDNSQLLAGQ